MENLTTGAGLGALGFWLFIAAIIAVGVWDNIRKHDAQHETLRRIIESGQSIDEELTDKLLILTGGSKTLEKDLWASGLIILCIAPGLAVFGWVMSLIVTQKLLMIMLAVAALLIFLGAGLLVAARLIGRWDQENSPADFG